MNAVGIVPLTFKLNKYFFQSKYYQLLICLLICILVVFCVQCCFIYQISFTEQFRFSDFHQNKNRNGHQNNNEKKNTENANNHNYSSAENVHNHNNIQLHFENTEPFKSLNMNDFPKLVHSNITGQLLDNYDNLFKYYYYDAAEIPELSFFEKCQIGNWAKNSQEHYLIQQLKYHRVDKNNHDGGGEDLRVYDCMAADIFVIPVSFGNARRGECGIFNETVLRRMVEQIQLYIFNHSKSCWNANPSSRQTHFMICGGFKGRPLIPLSWKQQFIIANTVSERYKHMTRTITHSHTSVVSHLAFYSQMKLLPKNIQMEVFYNDGYMHGYNHRDNTKNTNSERIAGIVGVGVGGATAAKTKTKTLQKLQNMMELEVEEEHEEHEEQEGLMQIQTQISNHRRLSSVYDDSLNNLPQIKVTNLIPFSARKYLLFFIGLANLKKSGYKMRRQWCALHKKHLSIPRAAMAAAAADADADADANAVVDNYDYDEELAQNVLIQTYGHAIFDNSCDMRALRFPCHLQGGSNQSLFIELMSKSKFSLMFRGADACSSRFYDALALDVINIVISDNFHRCLFGYESAVIPWQKMFLWLSESEFRRNPKKSVYSLLGQYTDADFEEMLRLIEKWKPHILWDVHRSQTARSLLFNSLIKYGPETWRIKNHIQVFNKDGTPMIHSI